MSTAETFRPDEVVSVAYHNVKVLHHGDHSLQIELPNVDDAVEVRLADDDGTPLTCVQVTRTAPADWPPRYGDLWEDVDGVLWTLTKSAGSEYNGYRAQLDIECLNTDRCRDRFTTAAGLLRGRGPFTLVHRRFPDPIEPEGGWDE